MGLLRFLSRHPEMVTSRHPEMVTLSWEEAQTAIKALQRSAETFHPDETIGARDMRASRELRLVSAINQRLN